MINICGKFHSNPAMSTEIPRHVKYVLTAAWVAGQPTGKHNPSLGIVGGNIKIRTDKKKTFLSDLTKIIIIIINTETVASLKRQLAASIVTEK